MRSRVSKLFRAYGLYNVNNKQIKRPWITKFQSSFELTGYITQYVMFIMGHVEVSKLFRAYGLYNLCSLEGARILNPSGLFAIGFKKVDKKCV